MSGWLCQNKVECATPKLPCKHLMMPAVIICQCQCAPLKINTVNEAQAVGLYLLHLHPTVLNILGIHKRFHISSGAGVKPSDGGNESPDLLDRLGVGDHGCAAGPFLGLLWKQLEEK